MSPVICKLAPGNRMFQENFHHGWTAGYVEEKQEGQTLQVIEEDDQFGQLARGEGVEGGKEGRKGQVEASDGGDGPGRAAVGCLGGEPHVGHSDGEKGPAQGDWTR